jgi:hypothetical protein
MTVEVDYAEKRREQIRNIQRDHSAKAADITQELIVVDPERRSACERDLYLYLQTYYPNSTGISPFSDDHRRVIAKLQDCFLSGGRFVEAVYRGFAKTTISQNTALWALSYGHRRCLPIFGATDSDAKRNMQSIKLELETNDLLFEDFPEICVPARALQGRAQRCASQSYRGQPTHIDWTAEQIVLPTIAGSKASGGIVVCRGLTGASRGLVFKRPDGTNQRPDGVLIDDPQTDESAISPAQVEKRLDIIKRSILKSGGHRNTLACVVTCTVRAENDVAEQLLNHKISPSWQGERIRMVKRWADEHGAEVDAVVPRSLGPLWGTYKEIRNTFDRESASDQKRAWRQATEFYEANQAAMDAGCLVSWEGCFDREHETSAIQHAYNILIDDGPDVFSTECQNGTPEDRAAEGLLSKADIADKANGYERRLVPRDASYLTAFIDVQGRLLYWSIVAWRQDFTGYVIDYGAWPKQTRPYFTLADAAPCIQDIYHGGAEAEITAAMTGLVDNICGESFPVDGGGFIRVNRCLVDSGWNADVVKQFCRQSKHSGLLLPSKGYGIKASSKSMSEWSKEPGQQMGNGWVIKRDPKFALRMAHYDANKYKTFVHARLMVPKGGVGCLSLYKALPSFHQMLADHTHAEYPVRVSVKGSTVEVDEWQHRPNRPDNHLFDCLVGCAVGGSILGASLDTDIKEKRPNARPRTRVNMSGTDGRSFFITNR